MKPYDYNHDSDYDEFDWRLINANEQWLGQLRQRLAKQEAGSKSCVR